MKYKKSEAKEYAREHMVGVWAANLTPFNDALQLDEKAYRDNLNHWVNDLKLGGLFIAGKQAEFFSMSIAERKRLIDLSVEVASDAGNRNGAGACGIVTSCSDTNLDVVLELAEHSKNVGADYVIVHSPVLHFGADTDETIYEYYRYLSEKVDLGLAMWNHPDCGYVMSPELCARIAELPNVVAIKYSTDRAKYARLTEMVGDKIHVSNPDEPDWLENIIELGWKLYLCSTPPFLLQSKVDQRMNEYTQLAFAGKFEEARKVRDSLDPVREAIKHSKPKGKPQAHGKYWQELLGQHGGPVRRPLLQLTEAEREATRQAFAQCGLRTA
ncbi:dihydrodipicolinate synthase family protein [Limnohabitans sp. TS-CS-82]|uniref:dihydrodipicolinate synthase family protein n=1 Tax=Limnohabitans sp. TS-CS-82 TaxID=2094193 RepID=UPI000CF24EB1|nr:dihydrodipicolinate synthase family protein [Limnohabitans sp. TS-CS-82]PQA80879.1 dihydrodipicolinate synthase family protein [Limnohabitans sp. TS-CS-82]